MILTIFIALITAVLGPIAVEWAKTKISKSQNSKPNDALQEAIIHNDLVNKQLEIIIDKLDCSRVWISQFHNGGHFYPTGKSIQKFSIFYEKISPNSIFSKSIQSTFTNIPVSLFPRPLTKLQQSGELEVVDFSKDEDYGLSIFAEEYQVKSLYMLSLTDLDDKFIGVIHLSYGKQHKLTHEEWVFLRQKVGTIGSLLTEYLYQNNKK